MSLLSLKPLTLLNLNSRLRVITTPWVQSFPLLMVTSFQGTHCASPQQDFFRNSLKRNDGGTEQDGWIEGSTNYPSNPGQGHQFNNYPHTKKNLHKSQKSDGHSQYLDLTS